MRTRNHHVAHKRNNTNGNCAPQQNARLRTVPTQKTDADDHVQRCMHHKRHGINNGDNHRRNSVLLQVRATKHVGKVHVERGKHNEQCRHQRQNTHDDKANGEDTHRNRNLIERLRARTAARRFHNLVQFGNSEHLLFLTKTRCLQNLINIGIGKVVVLHQLFRKSTHVNKLFGAYCLFRCLFFRYRLIILLVLKMQFSHIVPRNNNSCAPPKTVVPQARFLLEVV